jgi:hypothetical protein
MRTISYDDWVEEFKPIQNEIDTRGFDGLMFETFGSELAMVTGQDRAKIWTYVESDGVGEITSGYHHVNRLGYFICQVAVTTPDEFINVILWDSDDDEDDVHIWQ